MTKETEIAVISIQDTLLKSHHTIVESQIHGYKEIRAVRPTRKGVGTSLYIQDELSMLKSNAQSNDVCGDGACKNQRAQC